MIEDFWTWLIGGVIIILFIITIGLHDSRLGKPSYIGSPFPHRSKKQ